MQGERRLLARRGNRRYRVFLAVFAGVAVTAATAVLAFTVLVDPFGMIGLVEIEGFNASKPHMFSSARQIAFTSMTGRPKADATHLTPAGVIAHGHRLFVAFRQLSPQKRAGYAKEIASNGLLYR